MKLLRAVIAGVLGALAMSLSAFLFRSGGININLEALLGSIVPPPVGLDPWMLGFLIHLAIGAAAGFVYAAIFEMAVQRSGPFVGAGLGLCHGMLAGLFMSGIPAMNPLALGTGSAPGPFLNNLSYGPLLFLLMHIIFGAVVGVAYGRPVNQPHVYTNRTA